MPNKSFADVITDWEKLLATVTANKDDLQSLEGYRQQLEAEVAAARSANMRQSAAQAASQQATRDIESSLKRGRDLADQLRFGIKSRYGKRNEKLTEFGMKVFRGGGKKSTLVKPPPEAGPPPGTSPPAETKAASQEATSEAHNPS